jgi:hypothetical protein
MDCCMHIRLLAESLHNIPYQTLLKSIQNSPQAENTKICVICGLKNIE